MAGTNGDNGAAVDIFDCLETNQHQWYWNGSELRNRINNKCLDISGANQWNGAALYLWDCGGVAQQQWHTT